MTSTGERATRAAWARIHRIIESVGVDLSDYSDEFVAGFAEGVQAERDRLQREADERETDATAGQEWRSS